MLTFAGACVLFWLWHLCKREGYKTSSPVDNCRRSVTKTDRSLLPEPMPFWHPWNKELDTLPSVK